MIPIGLVTAAALLLALAAPALAADPGRGREKAEPCLGCHGETGNSQTEEMPSLAGQPRSYTAIQLILFRDGLRKNPQMAPFAQGLSDQDIEDLAAYFADQKPEPPAPPADPALAAEGKGSPTPITAARAICPTIRAASRWPAWPDSGRTISSSRCASTRPARGRASTGA